MIKIDVIEHILPAQYILFFHETKVISFLGVCELGIKVSTQNLFLINRCLRDLEPEFLYH